MNAEQRLKQMIIFNLSGLNHEPVGCLLMNPFTLSKTLAKKAQQACVNGDLRPLTVNEQKYFDGVMNGSISLDKHSMNYITGEQAKNEESKKVQKTLSEQLHELSQQEKLQQMKAEKAALGGMM